MTQSRLWTSIVLLPPFSSLPWRVSTSKTSLPNLLLGRGHGDSGSYADGDQHSRAHSNPDAEDQNVSGMSAAEVAWAYRVTEELARIRMGA